MLVGAELRAGPYQISLAEHFVGAVMSLLFHCFPCVQFQLAIFKESHYKELFSSWLQKSISESKITWSVDACIGEQATEPYETHVVRSLQQSNAPYLTNFWPMFLFIPSENTSFSGVLKRYKMETLTRNELMPNLFKSLIW